MASWDTIISLITLALVAVVSFIVTIGKGALETAVKTSAEEGVKTAIKNVNSPEELRQELEKSRGVERQELHFQELWNALELLRPLRYTRRTH